MPSLRQLLRAVLIGLLIGGAIYWWRWQHARVGRIEEVRQRVAPRLQQELEALGASLGDPLLIRIFKESHELEVWIRPQKADNFLLFRIYHTVLFSGKLGPKLAEGDSQAPEGFYEVTSDALNPLSGRHLAFDIGFPNNFDRAHGRTGSCIMVHGGRDSAGCFAVTDPAIEEIYLIAEAALRHGQRSFGVHVFPFRMTNERMHTSAKSEWLPFWEKLSEGYLRFEDTHVPPVVHVENGEYKIEEPVAGRAKSCCQRQHVPLFTCGSIRAQDILPLFSLLCCGEQRNLIPFNFKGQSPTQLDLRQYQVEDIARLETELAENSFNPPEPPDRQPHAKKGGAIRHAQR
jgi:murein L,D-transpeptidase YafK